MDNLLKMDNSSIQAQLGKLYTASSEYRQSENYRRFLALCTNFKRYSMFNVSLVYLQMPGARFYLTENEWERSYGRLVKNDERPLIALQPFAPIMLLYDVSQTIPNYSSPFGHQIQFDKLLEPLNNYLPERIDGKKYTNLLDNLPYFGIQFSKMRTGSLYAGKLQVGDCHDPLMEVKWTGKDGFPHVLHCPPAYTLKCSESLTETETFTTLAHELGHFFLHHLPCAFKEQWSDSRCNLDNNTMEFEAESVAWLVCKRLKIDNPSQKYLAGYLNANQSIPPVDILAISKAVEKIEAMYRPVAFEKGMLYKYNPDIRAKVASIDGRVLKIDI